MTIAQVPDTGIVVLGSANIDLVVPVDALPAPGETVLGGQPQRLFGGKGANQAVAAARAGGRVALVGCVGGDDDGRAVVADLARAGVDTTHVRTSAHPGTGLAVVLVGADGENQIVVSPGANHRLDRDDVDRAQPLIAAAGVLLAQLEVPLDVVRHGIQVAAAAGTTVVLNLSPAQALDAGTLGLVDVLVVNRSEAAHLLGDDVGRLDGAAERLRRLGPRAVVLTAGAEGAVCASAEGVLSVPALPVTVVDTTGAGDAFAGTLAAELARGTTLAGATVVAGAAGAAATQRHGAR